MSSSHSKKHRHTSKGEWSQRIWDSERSCYYRRRDVGGKYQYEWDESAPRTIPSQSSTQSTSVDDTVGSDPPYYKYDGSGEAQEPVAALSDRLGNIAFSEQPSIVTSYQETFSTSSYFSSSSTADYSPSLVSTGNSTYPHGSFGNAASSMASYGGAENVASSNPAEFYKDSSEPGMVSHSGYSAIPEEAGLSYQATPTGAGPYGYEQPSGAGEGSSSTTMVPGVSRVIRGTGGDQEKLYPDFKIHPSKKFKPGCVIKVVWVEPMGVNGSNATNVTEEPLETKYGQKVQAGIRRFVIFASGPGHSQCVPILTYHRQGTNKPGAKIQEHAMIYTGGSPPALLKGESPLVNRPIQMIPINHREKLDAASRINYAKYYTVEHNVKVKFIGRVASGSEKAFRLDANAAWDNKIHFS